MRAYDPDGLHKQLLGRNEQDFPEKSPISHTRVAARDAGVRTDKTSFSREKQSGTYEGRTAFSGNAGDGCAKIARGGTGIAAPRQR
jgi:hypothetical protein